MTLIGSGKVSVLYDKIALGQQTTPLPIYVDNTMDTQNMELATRAGWAHIRKPDDRTGKYTRRGSLDAGNPSLFNGTVIVAPST